MKIIIILIAVFGLSLISSAEGAEEIKLTCDITHGTATKRSGETVPLKNSDGRPLTGTLYVVFSSSPKLLIVWPFIDAIEEKYGDLNLCNYRCQISSLKVSGEEERDSNETKSYEINRSTGVLTERHRVWSQGSYETKWYYSCKVLQKAF